MNDLQKRQLMFLGFCIPSRLLLAITAKYVSTFYLKIMGFFALIPVIGWIYIYLTGARKTGVETLGQPIWWNTVRPIHAGLYLIFSLYAISGNNNAYIALMLDVCMGLIIFLKYHNIV